MSTFYIDNLVKSTILNKDLTNISNKTNTKPSDDFLYKDLLLDLNNIQNSSENFKAKDIEADYDITAIKNSIYNLLQYRPGHFYLNPKLGINLEKYLFDSITEFKANIICTEIKEHLTKYESRISKVNVKAFASADIETLKIEIKYLINIPGIEDNLILNFDNNFYGQ